ncbi:hypothetical protein NL533_34540, partial [Klebsiella pneumoniae]|nr:hypothetical protein [Klebsiella pneumoniae]
IGVGNETPTQRVGAGHTRFQCRAAWRKPLQPAELLHRTEPARRSKRPRDSVAASLVMRRRAEAARRCSFKVNSLDIPIE